MLAPTKTIALSLTALIVCLPAVAADSLQEKFKKIEQQSGGTLGASVLHLESGQTMQYNPDTRFPTASVVKLVEAIAFLKLVDKGQYKLNEKIHLSAKDIFPVAHSPLIANFPPAGLDVTYDDLLKQSICQSDTTADAILLDRAGGPQAVQAVMNEAGCPDIHVKNTECQLILDYSGVKEKVTEWWNKDKIAKLVAAVPKKEKSLAAKRFIENPENDMTPAAITDMLAKLYRGKLLKPETTEHLLKVMEQTATGPKRLKGDLPVGTVVAHKTGTWDSTDGINAATNDAGIITLPGRAGHLSIAVFVKNSTRPAAAREKAIAAFSKLAYDHWSASK
ncbi:MAG: class A beta-lactamase [Cyanobacteria bacterium SZAS TMP-1]|nr:class A beta-lactamase [Cyanobacteria bacterium SZAS TMP-1]